MSVVDKDLGWKRIQKDIIEFATHDVVIGWMEGEKDNRSSDGEGGREPVTNAELAVIHEFGTKDGRIEEGRLGLREWSDRSKREIATQVEKAYKRSIDKGGPRRELEKLGLWGTAAWKKYQRDVQPGPDLKDSTKAAKLRKLGSAKAGLNKKLQVSSQLVNGITHQVRRKSIV